MVDNQVNVTKEAIPYNVDNENTFTVSGALTAFHGAFIEPSNDQIDSTGSPLERVYDFLVATSGNALGVTVNVKSRSVDVPLNTPASPYVVATFFTGLLAGSTAQFFAERRFNKNGVMTYDLFFTEVGTGTVEYDLTVISLDVLPGSFPTLPVTANAPAATFMVLREVKGLVRVYDYFILSVPAA